MGQACGKIEADKPCFDSPYEQKQPHAEEQEEVKVQVVVGLWPKEPQPKQQTVWDDSSDILLSGELSDSASSNVQSSGDTSQRRRVTRNRRRSSQEFSGSFIPSTCSSIIEGTSLQARAASETSYEAHQQARRRHSLTAGAPVKSAHGAAQEEVPSPIEGLTIGVMVGRGSYGRVYKGMYNGDRVAVKVVEDVDSISCDENGTPFEASLSSTQDLSNHHSGLLLSRHCEFVAANAVPKARRLSGHSCSRTGSECWMLFDYCDKGCLSDAVENGWFGTYNPQTEEYTANLETVAVTAHEIASAMAHLHGQGVVHGDLSSNNIMLHSSTVNSHGFSARVGDFGRASKADDAPTDPPKRADTALSAQPPPAAAGAAALRPARAPSQVVMHPSGRRHSCSSINQVSSCTRSQPRHGTVTHMPPEALVEQVPTSKAGDVFAFGVLLWEMLTGQRPWGGLGQPQVVFQVAVLGRSLEIPPGLPPHLHSLLARCLAHQPASRCTFNEAVEGLQHFIKQHKRAGVK